MCQATPGFIGFIIGSAGTLRSQSQSQSRSGSACAPDAQQQLIKN